MPTTHHVSASAGGGGTGSAGNPYTLAEALAVVPGAGDDFKYAPGTYSRSTTAVFPAARHRSVNSDWSLQTLATGVPKAILDAGGNFIKLATGAAGAIFEFMGFANNSAAFDLFEAVGASVLLIRCRASNSGQHGFHALSDGMMLVGCEADTWGTASSGYGVYADGVSGVVVDGCHLHDGTGSGAYFRNSIGSVLRASVVSGCSLTAVLSSYGNASRPLYVAHNILRASQSGLQLASASTQPIHSVGNVFHGNSTYAVQYTGSGSPVYRTIGDVFYNNTSGQFAPAIDVVEPLPRILPASDPLVNAAGGDYRTRGAASLLRWAGFPDKFLAGGALTARQAWFDAGLASRAPLAMHAGLGGMN